MNKTRKANNIKDNAFNKCWTEAIGIVGFHPSVNEGERIATAKVTQ